MTNNPLEIQIKRAAELIKASKRAVAFTGAGISTPSGIPDFRSPQSGLWEHYDPFEVASLTAFRNHPEKFYGWIGPLVKTAKAAQPNQAHVCLAKLKAAGILQAVITQNIDGLHQKAGSKEVIELHGSAQTATCLSCGKQYSDEWLSEEQISRAQYPHCKTCGGVLKPDVVLFEEMLPVQAWNNAQFYCEQADLVLIVGSSLEVYPACSLPETALNQGAKLIINNIMATHLDLYADVVIHEDLIEAIPAICRLVLENNA
jgi:NAD-dependent deacetylase